MSRIMTLIVSVFLMGANACHPGDGEVAPPVQTWPAATPVPVEGIPETHWFVHGPDWIIAPDLCVARSVALELDAARSMFETHFQPSATRGVVLSIRYATQMAALRAAGVDWVLPWQFPELGAEVDPVHAALSAQIRSQIESQLSANGATPDAAQVDAMMARALEQLDAQWSRGASSAVGSDGGKRTDAIRHEVAHLLFIREIWPASSTSAVQQYGGDAPDWLDETAAVLAESDEMTHGRRQALIEAIDQGTLMPLSNYLNMPHPSFGDGEFARMIEEARANADDSGVIFLRTEDNDSRIDDAALFYTQTRAWIDFLNDRSGDVQIFARITEALKGGQSFAQWLATSGTEFGLPEQLPLLESEFQDWAAAAASG